MAKGVQGTPRLRFSRKNAVGGLVEGTIPDWLSVTFLSQQNKAGGPWELK